MDFFVGCRSEGALVDRVRIQWWVMYGAGLYIPRVVCCKDASVRMPSLVLVGCLVQSRGAFTIGQSIFTIGSSRRLR